MKHRLFIALISIFCTFFISTKPEANISFGIGFGGPFYGTGYIGDYWAGDWYNYYGYGPVYGPGFGFGVTVPIDAYRQRYYDDYLQPQYVQEPFLLDSTGREYWYIINKTNYSIIVENQEDSVAIDAHHSGRLTHRNSFIFHLLINNRTIKIKSKKHRLTINISENGKIMVY